MSELSPTASEFLKASRAARETASKPPAPANKGDYASEAVSPTGTDVLEAIYRGVKTPGLTVALESFLVDVANRASEAEKPSDLAASHKIFQSIVTNIEDVCREDGLDEESIRLISHKIIEPAGSLASPIGRISNYPPNAATFGGHNAGMNANTWTGEQIFAKHGKFSGQMWDLQILTGPTGSNDSSTPLSRGMADPELDQFGVQTAATIHRVAWDGGLIALENRIQSQTVSLTAGPQPATSYTHVAEELVGQTEWRREEVKTSLIVNGVSNKYGEYPSGSADFTATIIFRKVNESFEIGSLGVHAPMWCAGRAASDRRNSPVAYRHAAVIDAAEDFLYLIENGQNSTKAAHSNLARAALPRDLSQALHPTTLDTIIERHALRGMEKGDGIAVALKHIPHCIRAMHVRRGDLTGSENEDQTHVGSQTVLQYLCSRSAQRAVVTMSAQQLEIGGMTMNGLQARAYKSHGTLKAKRVVRNGATITGTSNRVFKQYDTMYAQEFELEDGSIVNGVELRALKFSELAGQTVTYEGEEMTLGQRTGVKAKATKAGRQDELVDAGDGRTLPRYVAANAKGLAKQGKMDRRKCMGLIIEELESFIIETTEDDGTISKALDWDQIRQRLYDLGYIQQKYLRSHEFRGSKKVIRDMMKVELGEEWEEWM